MKNERIDQQLNVTYDFPVVFTRDLFDAANPLLVEVLNRRGEARVHRVMVFLDDGLAAAQPQLAAQLTAWMQANECIELVCNPIPVVGGEACKNDYRNIMAMVDSMLEYKLCRHSFVMAMGGGAVLDAVGFAASLVHRGLRLVRLPSTVLAQNDAGIGVKTGMNLHGGKNTVGTFAPPFAVINDLNLLNSLSQEHWISGLSEAFKVALIKDAAFFQWLEEHAEALGGRDDAAMAYATQRCAELHLEHIRTSGDPFEQGTARPLDFGHWLAHRLEGLSNYCIPHGHAVAAGIALDSRYAATQGWISTNEADRICMALSKCGFALSYPQYEVADLLQGLEDFREHLGGELCITFPDGIGAKREESVIDTDVVKDLLVGRGGAAPRLRPAPKR